MVHVGMRVNIPHVMQTVMHCADTSPKVGYRGWGWGVGGGGWGWGYRVGDAARV